MEDFPFVSGREGLLLAAEVGVLRGILLFLGVVARYVLDRELLPVAEEPLKVFRTRRLISSNCLAFSQISFRVQNSGRILRSSSVSYIQVGSPLNIRRQNE